MKKSEQPIRTGRPSCCMAKFLSLLLFLLVCGSVSFAQNIKVSGQVTDADTKQPIAGVAVMVENSQTGVVADQNGKYTISAPKNGKLVFSFLGYSKKTVAVNGQTRLDVTLASEATSMEELVVVGYGVVKKKDLTGAVAAIGQKELSKTVVNSPEQALQGNAAGVVVITTTAEPGAEVAIRVRGSSSISGGNEPLIVIDNIPADKEAFAALSINDIQSMDVLKDAAATAIYGSRGANGVIMITTKSGVAGKTKVVIDAKYGISEAKNLMPMMDAVQYTRYDNIARLARGVNSLRMNDYTQAKGENFQKMLVSNGYRQEYNVQVSGGNQKNTFFVSANVLDEKGLLKNSNSQRLSVRGQFNMKLHENISLRLNTSASKTKTQKISGGDNGAMVRSAMVTPVTQIPEGSSFEDGWFIDSETGELTPINDVLGKTISIQNYVKPFKFDISGQLTWNILPKLTFMTRGSWKYTDEMQYLYEPRYSQSKPANIDKNNKARRTSKNGSSWVNENTLSYVNTFNKKHNLNVMAGLTFEKKKNENFYAQVNKFETDDYLWNNLEAGLLNPVMKSGSNMYSLVSMLGRVMYDYDQRYYITGTFRADGSSRFGPDRKYGYFPSVALAWNMKNEKWLVNSKAFSRLKLRLTYGITGNDDISQYTSMSLLNDSKVLIGGTEAIGNRLDQMGNAQIQWETTHQYNAGIDFGFLDNKLTISMDAYYKITKNLLYDYRLPLTTGYSTIMSNIGRVDNKGIEIELTSRNFNKKNFQWTTSFNMGLNKSRVVDLGDNDKVVLFRGNGMMKVDILYLEKDQPLSVFRGHQVSTYRNWAEVYDDNAVYFEDSKSLKTIPGMIKYQDTNDDGQITDADMVVLGHSMPDATFGFTNTFTWKQFDLTVFFNGAYGNKAYNGNGGKLFTFEGGNNNQFRTVMDCYRPMDALRGDPGSSSGKYPIPIAKTKGPASSQVTYTSTMNSNLVEDASYLRLKSLSLTYRLPVSFCKKLHMSAASISFNATNLWTLTNYTGMDPEMCSTEGSTNGTMGIDRSAYPAARTYTFNLNISF